MKGPCVKQVQHVEKNKNNQAFTLIEMSIVLVIIALLIGGVFAGQSLIRASELRAFTTQYQGIKTALDSFKDKYGWIPGDMPDATNYWPAAAAGAACITTASMTATCNGNGDKLITDPGIGGQVSNELWRFWQHLALAGFIQGSYDGISGGGAYYWINSKTNAPLGKINNSGWFTYNWGSGAMGAGWYNGNYANTLEFGTMNGGDASGVVFKPSELWNIDTKIDDGKPGTGILTLRTGTLDQCTTSTSTTDYAGDYLNSSNTVACTPLFPNAY